MNLIKLAAYIALATGLGVGAFSDAAIARSRTPTDGGRMNDSLEFEFFLVDTAPDETPINPACNASTCLFESAIEDFRVFFDGKENADRGSQIGSGIPLSGVASTFDLKATQKADQILYTFENNGVSLYDEILNGVPANLVNEYEKQIGGNSNDKFIRFVWFNPDDVDRALSDLSYIRTQFVANVETEDSAGSEYDLLTPKPDVEDQPIQSVPEPTTTVGFLVLCMLGLGAMKRNPKLQ